MIYLVSNTAPNEENIALIKALTQSDPKGANLIKKDELNLKHLKVCEVKFGKFEINLDEFANLIITSKNSINSLKFNAIKPSAKIKVFAIGEASFAAAKEFGFSDIYISKNSHGNEFAHEISTKLNGEKTLYLKARKTASDIDGILLKSFPKIDLKTVVAYENICTKNGETKPEKDAILIFTSPKNIECFVDKFGWDSSYKAISIGKTTHKFLSKYTKPYLCEFQSINECIKLALLII